jgi:hypothetical protein
MVLLLEDMRKQNAATIEAVFSTARSPVRKRVPDPGEGWLLVTGLQRPR